MNIKEYKARKLYRKLLEEFEKGEPNSEVNKNCDTKEDVAIYAMRKFANKNSFLGIGYNDNVRNIVAIILALGGITLGLCSVSGWGWLIFLSVLAADV